MDREDLDRKLKENGEAMKETSHGSKSGRMKIAALALSMLIIGGAGGCYFGDFALPKKGGAASGREGSGGLHEAALAPFIRT